MTPRNTKWTYLLISLLTFGYVAIRVFSVGATFDEVWTIQGPAQLGFIDAYCSATPVANNQLLNTVLIKALFSLGNDSLAIARLPSLFACILYLYFGYKITSKTSSPLAGIGYFLLLVCNPFLLDFFGLARGYGLSLAFMLGALFLGMQSLKNRDSAAALVVSLAFASLSVISIYSMIYFWLGLAITLNLLPILDRDYATAKRSIAWTAVVGLALLAAIATPMYRLLKADALSYGGRNSLYSDTLLSLARYSMYSDDVSAATHLALVAFLTVTVTCASVAFLRYKKLGNPEVVVISTTLASIILMTVAHYAAGVLYPLNRVALFIYPLLILCLCLSLDKLGGRARAVVLSCITAAAALNFTLSANTYRTALWGFESHTNRILSALNHRGAKEHKIETVACTSVLEQSINYYKCRYPFVKIVSAGEGNIVPEGIDFYILAARDLAKISEGDFLKKWVQPLEEYQKDIFMQFPKEHVFVFRNLQKS